MIKRTDLPEDIRAYLAKAADDSTAQTDDVPSEQVLAAIGVAIGKLRDEAKEFRITSGIEDRWRDAEEAYAGIDDANRHEMNGGHEWTKSMSKDGPITADDVPDTNNRSTLFVRLTQRYVDSGTAKLGEIILAPGARSFSLKPTPLPDLISAKKDNSPVVLDHMGNQPAMIAAKPGEISAPPPVSPAGAPVPAPAGGAVPPAGAAGPAANGQPVPGQAMRPLTVADLAKEKLEQAEEAAKAAEKRIYDWHVECGRTAEIRKVIFDSGRLGVGVLKGPFAKKSRQIATRKTAENEVEVGIREVIQPGSKWVNAWNFFPDPSCGENIHDGDHCFEREWMGARGIRKLKGMPGYIPSQIDKVLAEGPQKIKPSDTDGNPEAEDVAQHKKGKYEVWYFYGTLTRAEMGCICEAAGPGSLQKFNAAMKEDQEQVYAIVTMINDSVVRATVNPLDSGEFPYHAMPWARRTGCWAGVGIAEQIATPQKMLTAAVRAMLDNAGISAGGQIVLDPSAVTPADGDMALSPHKIWYMNGDNERLNVNEMFGLFKIDNVTAEMMEIVNLAMRLGEESTNIPLVTQGQSGPTTPDTFGAAQLQNNNANQLLRSIGYTFDDAITEPETRQYYEWLLLDPDVPNEEKGDWTIDAHGSSALVEQALQDQFLLQGLSFVQNPANPFGVNPKKWFAEIMRSKKLNPETVQYTEEEQANLDKQPPPAAPQVQAAQIRAATEEKKIAAIAADTQADNERAEKELATNATVELHTLQLKRELAMLEYANREKTTLDQIKAKLADTTMKLQVQERLSQNRNGQQGNGGGRQRRPQRAPQVVTPPTEPAGRARNGQAYQA